MSSRSLRDLDESFALDVGEWLRRCNRRGVAVLVYCTRRSLEEQAALYASGRDALGNETGGRILTNARPGESAHNFGLAIDAVPWEYRLGDDASFIERKLDWSPFENSTARKDFRRTGDLRFLEKPWRVLAEEAEAVGLEWSGRWKSFVEYVHFQKPNWRETR